MKYGKSIYTNNTMRDPDRIVGIIAKLQKAWQLEPDWRLGQLISNLHKFYGERHGDSQPIFNPEDDEWEALLDQFIDSRRPARNR